MKRALHSLLCLVTLLHLCGGHLVVAQVIAWGKMLKDYSAEKGWFAGVKETFDGDHPCAMCCQVRQMQQQDERTNSDQAPMQKADKVCKWITLGVAVRIPATALCPGISGAMPHDVAEISAQWQQQPPVPPPRIVA